MISLLFSILLLGGPVQQPAPADSITLQYCYNLAYENYPTVQNVELQHKITALNVRIAQTGYYPHIKVKGRATYQSEVTSISLPGGAGPDPISKDQYRASVSVVQNIFSGGMVGIQKELQQAIGRQKTNAVKVNLYQIRKQVNKVYYGILLSQQHLKVTHLLIENIKAQLQTIRSRVEHGVLLASQQYILKAELLKAQQNKSDIKANLKAGYAVLEELVGTPIADGTPLVLPQTDVRQSGKELPALHPRYDLFDSRIAALKQRQELAEAQMWPTLSAFGTFSYGRPGLNILDDSFHGFYMVGVRVKWDFWDLFNKDRQQQILEYKQHKVVQKRRAFNVQQQTSIDRLEQRIQSLKENIERAEKIIKLYEKIVYQTAKQLEHGVVTSTEYVTELNKASKARLSLFISRVQLAQAKTQYATVLGKPIQNIKSNTYTK